MSKVMLSYFELTVDPITKLRHVQAAPVGGFHKTNGLLTNNSIEQQTYLFVDDVPNDPIHVVKLIFKYRELCDPAQE